MMWSPAPLGTATSGSRTPSRWGLGPMGLSSGDLCMVLQLTGMLMSVVGPVSGQTQCCWQIAASSVELCRVLQRA